MSGFTAFTAAILAASVVWQGNTDGEPRRYTVTDGYVYFVTPPASDFNGRSVFIDYNKTATRPNSDGDAVTFVSDPQVYISWLEVAIKRENANGVISPDDSSVRMYEQRKAMLAMQDVMPDGLKMVIDPYGEIRI